MWGDSMLIVIFGLMGLLALGAQIALTAKIHAVLARLSTFLVAQDIDRRRSHVEDRRAREVRHGSIESFFKDTRAILGKMHTMAEELNPYQRETVEIHAVPTTPAASESRPRTQLPPAHQRAAGLGERPGGEHRLRRPDRPLPAPLPPPPRRAADTHPSMAAVKAPTSRPLPSIAALSKCPDCVEGVASIRGHGFARCETCGGLGEKRIEAGTTTNDPARPPT
jgi:hypothetical protein